MIESHSQGEHMSMNTFKQSLYFSTTFDPYLIFLSGGEPTDHPDFLDYLNRSKSYVRAGKALKAIVASNGMFLEQELYTNEILKLGVNIQITNDIRYYPKRIKKIEHSLLCYIDEITIISPFGKSKNVKSNKSPYCFNLRSATHYFKDAQKGLEQLRLAQKMCTPSINVNGDVVAGESSSCAKIGTVWSNKDELTKNILNLKCNKCGLHKNLSGTTLDKWNEFNTEGN